MNFGKRELSFIIIFPQIPFLLGKETCCPLVIILTLSFRMLDFDVHVIVILNFFIQPILLFLLFQD